MIQNEGQFTLLSSDYSIPKSDHATFYCNLDRVSTEFGVQHIHRGTTSYFSSFLGTHYGYLNDF